MINFPQIKTTEGPEPQRMSLEEYVEFCEICRQGNSRITPENCMESAEDIRVPFSFNEHSVTEREE